jgi:hypothetical protein
MEYNCCKRNWILVICSLLLNVIAVAAAPMIIDVSEQLPAVVSALNNVDSLAADVLIRVLTDHRVANAVTIIERRYNRLSSLSARAEGADRLVLRLNFSPYMPPWDGWGRPWFEATVFISEAEGRPSIVSVSAVHKN